MFFLLKGKELNHKQNLIILPGKSIASRTRKSIHKFFGRETVEQKTKEQRKYHWLSQEVRSCKMQHQVRSHPILQLTLKTCHDPGVAPGWGGPRWGAASGWYGGARRPGRGEAGGRGGAATSPSAAGRLREATHRDTTYSLWGEGRWRRFCLRDAEKTIAEQCCSCKRLLTFKHTKHFVLCGFLCIDLKTYCFYFKIYARRWDEMLKS